MGPSALIVEDTPAFQDILSTILSHAGYEVIEEAFNGNDALKLLTERTYDLAFLDLQLPGGKSGIEVMNQLRQDSRHDNLHIIIVTANPHMVPDNDQADFVMMKPFDVGEMAMLVQRIRESPSSKESH
jgi:CheY-like chemotaxis protein